MAKPKTRYTCQACGSVSHRWQGQCADCAEWNTLVQETAEVSSIFAAKHNLQGGGRVIPLVGLETPAALPERLPSGLAEFDRAIGGGIVAGSAMLVGGDPGIGKSTLLLQVAARLASEGKNVIYVSGEESAEQVRLRAVRLGLGAAPVRLAAATSVRDILTTVGNEAPALLIIDSIQTMHSDLIEGAPGTVSQVRASAQELVRFAKEHGTAVVLVGHVTKDGTIAGPRVLEHMVDTVLSFEGERSHQYRILRAMKNRFGGTDEIGVFAMETEGLTEVPNPSALFLTHRGEPVSGTSVFPAIEGSRPVLVEIQALVVRLATRRDSAARGGRMGQRAAGDDPRGSRSPVRNQFFDRRSLFECRRRIPFERSGGRFGRCRGARLGAVGTARAVRSRGVRRDRAVGRNPPCRPCRLRLKESAKLGFESGWVPKGVKGGEGLRTAEFANLRQLVDQILGR